MSDRESETPERPMDEARRPPDPPQQQFADLYTKYARDIEGYARKHLPTEVVEDVLSEFWLAVWRTIRSPGKFVDMGKTRGWLYRVLKRTICNYYRSQPKIMRLIMGSLDDEIAVNSIEASFGKHQDDLTQRLELRELLLATGEQCLTNEKHRMILHRDLDGEEEPPAGWTSRQVHDNRYRMLKKLEKAVKKVLGKA